MGDLPPLKLIEQRVNVLIATLERYTHYELLEVPTNADVRRVTRNGNLLLYAYRELMSRHACDERLRHHIARLCKRIEHACRVLTDPELRAEYDQEVDPVTLVERLHPLPRHATGEIVVRGADTRSGEVFDHLAHDLEEPTVTDFLPLRNVLGPSAPQPEPALETMPGLRRRRRRPVASDDGSTVPNLDRQDLPEFGFEGGFEEEPGDTLVDGPKNVRRGKIEGQTTTRRYSKPTKPR